jgi:hypothetical protein
MYINKILHDLSCQNCNDIQLNGISTVNSDLNIENYSHQELVVILNNFSKLKCEKCKQEGKWVVSKIFLAENKKATTS